MNIISMPLFLSVMAGSLYGKLELQVPASDFYYARESGELVNKEVLYVGNGVKKGQSLLEYAVKSEQNTRRLHAKTNGYVEFINKELNTGHSLSEGQLLFIVTSYTVLGKYQTSIESDDPMIMPGSSLWFCDSSEQWQFHVDEIKGSKLLISSNLDQRSFNLLDKLSKQDALVSFFDKEHCNL
ncbi:hypothetical protein [Pseudoalteromonas sp. MMG012]|uniref:hypothetical protein n=1 Tax=Pseudoalteromonas sp. MMG012 TaxID=2822686 RepID=UPI001B3A5193|nr:hypothetical protein [Pseudoalteromonas sp. MMG012]MBQ4850330.1 hypothetical protein [Pseudoalteromonas sp. MMG012]